MKNKLDPIFTWILPTSIVAIACVLISFHACATQSPIRNAYNTANASKLAYDTAMQSAASAYNAGLIDDKQKDKIIKAGQVYMEAHNAMVAALEIYLNNPDDKRQAFLDAYVIASQELLKLLSLINQKGV